jgi:hypothetical protein
MMRRVYRVETFIEHQDTCNASGGGGGRLGVAAAASSSQQQQQGSRHAAAALSRTASSASPSSGGDLVVSRVAWPGPAMASSTAKANNVAASAFHRFDPTPAERRVSVHNLELLQLMPPRGDGAAHPAVVGYFAVPSPHSPSVALPQRGADDPMRLQLSIGVGRGGATDGNSQASASSAAARRLKEEAREQLRLAMAEKAAAEESLAQARRQAELAEQELASARRMRQQARVELGRAHALRDHAVRQVDATLLQVTCYSCRAKFRARAAPMSSEVASYISSVVTTEGGGDHYHEVDNDLQRVNAGDEPNHGRMDLNSSS